MLLLLLSISSIYISIIYLTNFNKRGNIFTYISLDVVNTILYERKSALIHCRRHGGFEHPASLQMRAKSAHLIYWALGFNLGLWASHSIYLGLEL